MMIPGIKMDLGGTIYVVPPLSLGALEGLREGLEKCGDTPGLESVTVVIDALHLAMKRNYPDTTREHVANLVGLENMQEVFIAVMDVSGLYRKQKEKELEAGKAGAATK